MGEQQLYCLIYNIFWQMFRQVVKCSEQKFADKVDISFVFKHMKANHKVDLIKYIRDLSTMAQELPVIFPQHDTDMHWMIPRQVETKSVPMNLRTAKFIADTLFLNFEHYVKVL